MEWVELHTKVVCSLDIEGSLSVKKEIWYIGGYKFSKKYQATKDSIFDKPIDYAVGLYNEHLVVMATLT